MTIGFIGLGHVGKALAEKSVQVGNHVILSNRRVPSSLTGYVAELGPLAAAGTVAEAAQAEVVFLAVRWADIGPALQGLPPRRAASSSTPTSPSWPMAPSWTWANGRRASSWRPSCRAPG
jgi:pyrroline-5-carboxylate reductase